VNSPNPEVNLFETIPPNWHVEDRVRDQAAKLWSALPLAHRRIFNQIFWGRERFHRYVTERRCGESANSLTHLAWVVRATHEQLNRAVSDRATGLADLILNGLLMDAGSLEGPAPQSYVRLLEWLLLAHREMPQLDDDLMPRLAWQVLQVHGLIERPRTALEGNELVDRDSFVDLE
jgi:hypothetical protein